MVLCAVFAALAYAVMFVFRFNVQFLTFDLKDAVITVAGLLLGPVTSVSISLLVAVLESVTVGDTGFYGFIMNFASSATFSVVAAMVYRYRKRLSGAIVALCSAVVALVAVMLVLNLLITPIYQTKVLGIPMSTADVAKIIPILLLPFNAVKAVTNAALVLILYKPISRALRAAHLLPGETRSMSATPVEKKRHFRVSLAVSAVGVVILVAAVLIFFLALDGSFEFFRSA